jgi:hypothetical protein
VTRDFPRGSPCSPLYGLGKCARMRQPIENQQNRSNQPLRALYTNLYNANDLCAGVQLESSGVQEHGRSPYPDWLLESSGRLRGAWRGTGAARLRVSSSAPPQRRR